jgi:prephenate dehydrogenase
VWWRRSFGDTLRRRYDLAKITIVGTGLIGASLGLAMKKSTIRNTVIVGNDVDRRNAGRAGSMGATDETTGNLAEAVRDAQIVIIATPVMAMKEVMESIAGHLTEGCLVTDTGSSKGAVIEWADQFLPQGVSFVGGNPLVNKESSGPAGADGSLFQGRPYCIVPSSKAQQDAVKTLSELAYTIGATPYFIDVAEHDSFVAAVSHLPLLLSLTLAHCTSQSPSWDDIAKIASTQYRDITTLASGDPVTSRDIILSNKEGVVSWIDAFIHELYGIRKILVDDANGASDEALGEMFEKGFQARARWLAGAPTPRAQAAASMEHIPSARENMEGFLLGGSGLRKRLFGRGDKDDDDKDSSSNRR